MLLRVRRYFCISYILDSLHLGLRGQNYLKISELTDGIRKVDIEGEITEISETREVNLRAGGQAKVADAILNDETGSTKLSLWNEQIDQVNVGSKVKIESGYTNSFQGEVRLNIGRYGTLEVQE